MRISYLSLLIFLIFISTVGAAEIRDANRLIRVSNVASQFESMTLLQTRNIVRTYTSIVAMSAGVKLPQWIQVEIAACYEKTFAWEKFEDGVAQILLDNFSNHEIVLLTNFYRSEGLPPTEIPSFKAAIAKGEMIQQLTADYILANSEGCAKHDIDLILGFLADPHLEPKLSQQNSLRNPADYHFTPCLLRLHQFNPHAVRPRGKRDSYCTEFTRVHRKLYAVILQFGLCCGEVGILPAKMIEASALSRRNFATSLAH